MNDDDPRPAFAGDAADRALLEERLHGERVFQGVLLDVRRDRARLPDGHEAVREYIVHPGAVLVVPQHGDGRFIVERQFRYPHNRTFLEFPAGKIDAGEGPLDTAVRELAEEAGYAARLWTRLGVVHPGISYSTEAIEIYAARHLTHVGATLDHGEFLDIVEFSPAQLIAAQDDDRLTDAKTVAALAMHARWTSAARRSVLVRIRGGVQGVGYRDWAMRGAQQAHVGGWVRNRRDGSVEALIQGPRDACDRLIDACLRGPPAAQVERIEVTRCDEGSASERFELRPST
jgi:ADP-ribose pyrophosphatase